MMTIDRLNKPTRITSLDSAFKIAEENTKTDPDGWKYVVTSESKGCYYVDVYDKPEEGKLLGEFLGRL